MRLDLRNCDCMDLMREFPDKHFDLAIVDPPYGIGATATIGAGDKRSGTAASEKWGAKKWDEQRPDSDFFIELFRVSRHQIIFGGNYFADLLPASRCWLIWDKMERVNQADAELAWTSFDASVRIFQFWGNKLKGFLNPNRFHPTEKPVALYRWLLHNYAKPGDKILDTHLGSGSIAIACHEKGFDLTGSELDPDYFAAMQKRLGEAFAQTSIFDVVRGLTSD